MQRWLRYALPTRSPAQKEQQSSMSGPISTPDDSALEALEGLIGCIDASMDELQQARVRAEHLLAARRAGRPWLELVTTEARPLVVERISAVLASLATAGHRWRREEAAALQREQVSINRIAALFEIGRAHV